VLCHLNAAYNLARWLMKNDPDAEDAVQEATIRAFRAFGGFRGGEPKAWYLAIVRNTAMNHLRSKNRRAEIETGDESDLADVPTPTIGPDEAMERTYDAETLRHALEALPPAWREVVVLREFEQMSYRELSEVTGVPIGTVMSRLSRARQRLSELLREEGP